MPPALLARQVCLRCIGRGPCVLVPGADAKQTKPATSTMVLGQSDKVLIRDSVLPFAAPSEPRIGLINPYLKLIAHNWYRVPPPTTSIPDIRLRPAKGCVFVLCADIRLLSVRTPTNGPATRNRECQSHVRGFQWRKPRVKRTQRTNKWPSDWTAT
ncbi:uncharacterized protein P884DRAFT_271327 [Thermothelomyces heterothallicus CBS 202.75]|uniref:uncharacterized protein n=1 Tax=Thermothelomyces heterothallicus CBS 202.75 TaxID=1149848 RepID=UPI003741F220